MGVACLLSPRLRGPEGVSFLRRLLQAAVTTNVNEEDGKADLNFCKEVYGDRIIPERVLEFKTGKAGGSYGLLKSVLYTYSYTSIRIARLSLSLVFSFFCDNLSLSLSLFLLPCTLQLLQRRRESFIPPSFLPFFRAWQLPLAVAVAKAVGSWQLALRTETERRGRSLSCLWQQAACPCCLLLVPPSLPPSAALAEQGSLE